MIEKRICPLCGKTYREHPAISRAKGQEEICPECGTKQALTQFSMHVGRTCQTIGINEWTKDNKAALDFVFASLRRHMSFDWGDMDKEDCRTNDIATVSDDRLFSSYDIPNDLKSEAKDDKIWIITEWDRSMTTVLFPSEC